MILSEMKIGEKYEWDTLDGFLKNITYGNNDVRYIFDNDYFVLVYPKNVEEVENIVHIPKPESILKSIDLVIDTEKTIYDLKLHETTIISLKEDGGIFITRVPGGWIYNIELQNIGYKSGCIFIPYNLEFLKSIDLEPVGNTNPFDGLEEF